MGIFVGVNYGGREGVEILLVTTDWTSVGEGESCMQIFHTGWSGGTAGGRRRVWQAYCFHTWRGKDMETNRLPAGMGNGA